MNVKDQLIEIREKIGRDEPLTSEEHELLSYYNRYQKIHKYSSFAQEMFAELDWQWFQYKLTGIIDEFLETDNARLVVTAPPRHGKTLLCGLGLLVYVFGRYPELPIIYVTCNEDKATEVCKQVLELLAKDKYKKLFPEARVKSTLEGEIDKISKKTRAETRLKLDNVNSGRGGIKFASITAGIPGTPGAIILVDDPYTSRQQVSSQKERDMAWSGLYSNILSRSEGAKIIVMSTHWHPDDIIGRLRHTTSQRLKYNIRPWKFVNFPALVKKMDDLDPVYDIRTDITDEGLTTSLLWPEKRHEYIEAMEDPITFECMYQGKSALADGIVFKREYFQPYYNLPAVLHHIIISVDTNFKKTQAGSKCGITVWALSGIKIYLLEFINKEFSYVEMKNKVAELAVKYDNYWQIVIEEKANGYALIDDMKQRFTRIFPYNPKTLSKMQRAQATLPLFTDLRIFVPDFRLCFNIDVFVQQFLAFDGQDGTPNDLVDSSTQTMFRYIEYFKSLNVGKIHAIETSYVKMFGLPSSETMSAIGLGKNGTQKYKGTDRFGFSNKKQTQGTSWCPRV